MLNVLFLDDELMVLEALRRSLRSSTKEWALHFSSTVDECWEIIESKSIDVVITDMQMPGVDGAEFLASVKEQHPELIRFVLSGFRDKETAIKTSAAHRFLMKPVMSTYLVRHIADTSETLPDSKEHRRIINGATGLITSRKTIDALRALLLDTTSRTADYVSIISADATLTAKVLQIGNSEVFGLRERTTDIAVCAEVMGSQGLQVMLDTEGLVIGIAEDDPRHQELEAIMQQDADLTTKVGLLLGLEHGIDANNLGENLLRLWGVPV